MPADRTVVEKVGAFLDQRRDGIVKFRLNQLLFRLRQLAVRGED